MRLCAASAFLAITLPAAPSVSAQGAFVLMNERNHPELTWMELRTEHFRVFYHDPLEPWARDAASILERYNGSLCRKLDVTPGAPTRVYLSDQDQIANAAAVGWDYIFVWIPSHPAMPGFSGSRPWFEEVLVHEYTHILVSWASRTWIGNLAFLLGRYPPRWVHEGVAQWTAEPWSPMRGDETVAGAILDGSLDRNPPGTPGEGRLLYARGNARIRWLASSFGDSTIARLIRPAGRWGTYDYRSSERRAFGGESADLWSRFRRSMIAFYGERFRRGENPDSIGSPVNAGIAFPSRVSFGSPGVSWWTGQERRGSPEMSLFRRETPTGRQRRVVAGAVTGRPLPLANDACMVPRFHRVSHGSWVEDLGIWDRRGGFRFLTNGARIGEVDALPGGRTVALADSRQGPRIIEATGGDTLARFPGGWGLYDLAAAPSGDRVVVSAVESRGERSLWGLDLGRSGGIGRHRLLQGDERRSVWLDPQRIAWVSHRTGIAEVRTGFWLRDAYEISTDSARTSVGAGIAIAGARGDSVLVLDRSSRARTRVLSIAASRRPSRLMEGKSAPFPTDPAVQADSTADFSIDGPYRYLALREVHPWLLLPLIGPQGGDVGIGALGIWAEPLLRHAWGGYVYANAVQRRDPDRALFYLTSRLGPWAAAFHLSASRPRRILAGRVLYERVEETGVAILAPLSSAADPNVDGWFDATIRDIDVHPRGMGYRTPIGPPQSWSSIEISCGGGRTRIPPDGLGATGVRRGEGGSASMRAGIAPRASATRFLRGSGSVFIARSLPLPLSPSLWIEGRSRASSGDLPPQEYEGLDEGPSFAPIPGWPGIDGSIFLRGYPHARAARVVVYTDVELRLPILPDLGLRGPMTAIGGGTIAPFVEAAHLSGSPAGRFIDEPAIVTFGGEARLSSSVGPLAIVPSAAWGRPLSRRHGRSGEWSFRISAKLPLSPPLHPPTLLRSLIGGALHGEEAAYSSSELAPRAAEHLTY